MTPTFTAKQPFTVSLGYVHNGTVENEFVTSLIHMMEHDRMTDRYYNSLIHVGGAYIPQNRHMVVDRFLKTDAQWLFFIDNDMVFPPDSMKQMVEVADPETRPIVGALYFSYMGAANDTSIAPVWLEHKGDTEYCSLTQVDDTILTPLTVAGTGALIVHRSVFEKLKEVYANDPWHWFSHDIGITKIGNAPTHFGEDVTFCSRARACGFPVYGYAGLIMDHKKKKLLGVNDYLFQYHLAGKTSSPETPAN